MEHALYGSTDDVIGIGPGSPVDGPVGERTAAIATPTTPQRARPDSALRMLLDVRAVAEIIGCSEKAARHRIERGQLTKVVHIGRRVYLRRADLLRFISEGRGPLPDRSR